MRLSIRVRMILAMNLLVAAVGLAVGYAGIEVATTQVERKLVHESAANAAALIGRKSWPLDSDALMEQIAQVLGAEAASGDAEAGGIVASSLRGPRREELAGQLGGPKPPSRVELAGQWYRLGAAVVRGPGGTMPPRLRRFYLLVPERRVLAAQRQAAGRIALLAIAAVLIATGVGLWLSTTIARPVRDLADRMDHLAGYAPALAGESEPSPPAGPSELARLTRSFDGLLGRLADARRQLERSARLAALGQLAASVAHELRNPLSGIKMNARVLAEELSRSGAADRSLDVIVREIERMDLYLQELLSVAAAPDGAADAEAAPPATTEPVRLDELAESVVALLAGRCEHAGVTVSRAYVAAVPAVRAEAGRVRQVILNLMLNALDAMPHGGRVVLRTRRGDAAAVRFEVADTGGGVRVDDGADVFEPFVTTKPAGTGLGLYVCRRTVEALGGRVGYESSDGGSTFWFELPAAQ